MKLTILILLKSAGCNRHMARVLAFTRSLTIWAYMPYFLHTACPRCPIVHSAALFSTQFDRGTGEEKHSGQLESFTFLGTETEQSPGAASSVLFTLVQSVSFSRSFGIKKIAKANIYIFACVWHTDGPNATGNVC